MAGIAAGTGIGSAASCAAEGPCMHLEGCPGTVCTTPGGLLKQFSWDDENSDTPPFARGDGEAACSWCTSRVQFGCDMT